MDRIAPVELFPDHERETAMRAGRARDIVAWSSNESPPGQISDGVASQWDSIVLRTPEIHGPGLVIRVAVAAMVHRGFMASDEFWLPAPAPVIEGISPSEVLVTGGVITLLGSGFGTGGAVRVMQRIDVSDASVGPGARALVSPGVLASALGG